MAGALGVGRDGGGTAARPRAGRPGGLPARIAYHPRRGPDRRQHRCRAPARAPPLRRARRRRRAARPRRRLRRPVRPRRASRRRACRHHPRLLAGFHRACPPRRRPRPGGGRHGAAPPAPRPSPAAADPAAGGHAGVRRRAAAPLAPPLPGRHVRLRPPGEPRARRGRPRSARPVGALLAGVSAGPAGHRGRHVPARGGGAWLRWRTGVLAVRLAAARSAARRRSPVALAPAARWRLVAATLAHARILARRDAGRAPPAWAGA